MSQTSYPRFISNTPCGVDLFESGSQDKTAKSISNHIKEGNNDYRLIGLDGEWGSGKSNAISIIDKQLGDDYHLFIYDTWAHQEDLQRRSFIEELTDNLQKNNVVNQTEWKTKLNNLLAKKKVTITKTIPTLSWAIIASLLVAVIMPITKTISDSLSEDKDFYKPFITAAPLIIAVIVWIVAAFRDKQYRNLAHLFRIYERQDLKRISDETISEREPSLREFRNWIDKLNEDSRKKVIVVFDNMDRLAPEKIKTIWALLHTFFSSTPYSKIWVIVPFDRAHIRDAFGAKDDVDFEKTNHFINKTFSVIFNISPAVLTDWKNLFETKYNDAFGKTEQEEYIITRKIFDLHHTSITPRKIIAFINDLVALKLIWNEEIKLRYIAIFVLNRTQIIESPVRQILNKKFLSKSQNLFAGDETLGDNIAALLYNVPIEKAAQVTLQREIELAIRQRRLPELKEFANNVDFISILEQIETEDIDVDTTTTCLDEIESSIKSPDSQSLQVIWDRIVGRQISIQVQDLSFTDVHKILITKARPEQRKRLVKYFLTGFHQVRAFSGENYYKSISSLEDFLKSKNIEIDSISLIADKNVSAEEFVDYLNRAKENYSRYKVNCSEKDIDSFFSEKIPDKLEASGVIWYVRDRYKFTKLKAAIEKAIKASQITLQNVASVFDAYKAITTSGRLNSKIDDGKIYELLTSAEQNSKEYYELAAMRIARLEKFTNQGGIDSSILNLTDEKFIEELASRVQFYTDYGTLLLSLNSWPKPVTKALLKYMTKNSLGMVMSLENVLPSAENISKEIDMPIGDLLKEFNDWSEFLNKSLTPQNVKNIIPETLLADIIAGDNEMAEVVLENVIKYTENVSVEDWDEAYKNHDDYEVKVLDTLLKTAKLLEMPANAFSSYKETLKKSATSPEDYNLSLDENETWKLLYHKADKLHLQATLKDIRDSFLRDVDISPEQFIFFETPLRELGGLSEKSGEVVRKILTPLLSDDDCLRLLSENKEFYSSIVEEAGNDSFDFIDGLRSKIEANSSSEVESLNSSINTHLTKRIRIVYAKYYSDRQEEEEAIEVTDNLRRIVEQEEQIHFKVDNGIVNGKDPDNGYPKKLFVKYSYNNEQREKTFDEHNWLRLP